MKSDGQANRAELYQTTVDVLGPEIERLRKCYQFQEQSIAKLGVEIRYLSRPDVCLCGCLWMSVVVDVNLCAYFCMP